VATSSFAVLAVLAQAQAHGRHLDVVDVAVLRVGLEVRRADAAEVRQADVDDLVRLLAILDDRQLELDLGAVARFLVLQVPLALVDAAFGRPSGSRCCRWAARRGRSVSKATVFHSGLLSWPSLPLKSLARR
jgi:hypothetical protein